MDRNKSIDEEEIQFIYMISSSVKPIVAKIAINRIETNLEINTGVLMTLVGKNIFNFIDQDNKSVTLKHIKVKLMMGVKLAFQGEIRLA